MSENKNPSSYRRPVIVATTVLLGGIAASLAINLKAISLAANPEGGAYASGVFWPLALLASIELLIHTPWRKGAVDASIKAAVLVLVAGVAAWISYWHGVHVLEFWTYDAVGAHVGPLVPDAAMALATLALQRIGQARRLAKDAVATLASAAQVATVATPLTMATVLEAKDQATLATMMPASPMDEVAADWANLDEDLDRDLADLLASGQSAEEIDRETAEAAAEPTKPSAFTKVPSDAAKHIRAALEEAPGMAATTLADALVEAGLAPTNRTGRRYVAAIKNNTARVS